MLQTRCSRSSAVMLLYAVSPLYSLHPRPLPAASVRKNARTSNHSGCCSSAARTPPKAASSEVCHRAPRGTFAAGTQSIGKIRRDIVIRPVSQPCQKGYGGNGPTVLVRAEAGLGLSGAVSVSISISVSCLLSLVSLSAMSNSSSSARSHISPRPRSQR